MKINNKTYTNKKTIAVVSVVKTFVCSICFKKKLIKKKTKKRVYYFTM